MLIATFGDRGGRLLWGFMLCSVLILTSPKTTRHLLCNEVHVSGYNLMDKILKNKLCDESDRAYPYPNPCVNINSNSEE